MKKCNIKKYISIVPFTTLILAAVLSAMACKKSHEDSMVLVAEVGSKLSTPGIRIAWDYSTLRQVSDASLPGNYNGYGRIKQLKDKTLLAIYESGGNVIVRRSADNGKNWSGTVTVAEKLNGIDMAVPDLLQLQNGSLIAMYNPRPVIIDSSRKFGIRIKKSYDNGIAWKDEQLLYEAGYQFQNGCWEPAAVQLPNGEIQLYFANEGPYTRSDEQNISVLKSADNALTWTSEPQIASFRPGKRDGMPVPILLQDNSTIVFAIEDNGFNAFKPYTIRNTITENWMSTVGASSNNRLNALSEKLADEIYAGAPYLAQLKTGETILSYQGTEGRTNTINQAEMKVTIGDVYAKDFNRKTVPFSIPSNKSGLWNSLAVLDDNSIVAVTSTPAFSNTGRTDVWMIKGYVIPEISAEKNTITVDGNNTEESWKKPFPIFVGHLTESQVKTSIMYDDNNFYVLSKVKDGDIIKGVNNKLSDAITIYLDPQNKRYEKLHMGIFSITVTAGGISVVKEGKNGNWQALQNTDGIKVISKLRSGGYIQELAIPWALIGGKPTINSRVGINVRVTEISIINGAVTNEDASGCNANEPFTWLSFFLK